MAYEIELDEPTCVGCGACASVCDNFEVREGKAVVVRTPLHDVGCNDSAKDICPVDCISIKEV